MYHLTMEYVLRNASLGDFVLVRTSVSALSVNLVGTAYCTPRLLV